MASRRPSARPCSRQWSTCSPRWAVTAADPAGQPRARSGLHRPHRADRAITSPVGGASVNQGQTVTITGTASDVGGRVAGVEVSTDGGTTWHPATGTTSWSYAWSASGPGAHLIEARASDDSVNLQLTPATVSINVTGTSGAQPLHRLQHPAQTNLNDGSAARSRREVPVLRCRPDHRAQVLPQRQRHRLRSSRPVDLDRHQACQRHLYQHRRSGWQTVTLATPVTIAANTTYVASYHTTGAYVATNNFFTTACHERPADGATPAATASTAMAAPPPVFPNQHLQRRQLLGRCGVQSSLDRSEHAADGGCRCG